MSEIKETIDTTAKFEDVKNDTIFEKGKDAANKVGSIGKRIIDYAKENPVDTLVKVGTVLTAAVTIMTAVSNIDKKSKESKTVFSDDIKESLLLKRKLSNSDKVELDYRVKTGQTKIEALNEMGFIK